MDELFLAIGGIVLLIILIGAAVVGTWTGSMSDEQRERWGLGPKGQGRR